MKFTTNYENRTYQEQEGDFIATIESYEFRTRTKLVQVGKQSREVEFQDISITWRLENNSRKWDTIFQNLDDEGFATYDVSRINRISNALEIEEGIEFTVQEWLDYIVGKKAVILVRKKTWNERDFYNIVAFRSIKKHLEEQAGQSQSVISDEDLPY